MYKIVLLGMLFAGQGVYASQQKYVRLDIAASGQRAERAERLTCSDRFYACVCRPAVGLCALTLCCGGFFAGLIVIVSRNRAF